MESNNTDYPLNPPEHLQGSPTETPALQPTEAKPADPTLVQPERAAAQPAQAPTPMAAGSTLARPQVAPQPTAYAPQPSAYQPQAGYSAQQAYQAQAGYSAQQAYQAYRNQAAYNPPAAVPTAAPAPAPVRTKTIGRGRSLLWGIIGGAIGAAAVVCGLFFTGVLNPAQSVSTGAKRSNQPITITASDTDTSVAKAVAAKALPSVVTVSCTLSNGVSTGSGVILDADGNIITNNHVVDGAKSVTVTIEGVSYDAYVVGTDASSDIAVLRAEIGDALITPIEVGDSSALAPGDWVMTVGSPFGLDSSVSSGIVSSLSRSELMYGSSGNTLYTNLIQVDAAINPGNSGGALVDEQGKLVGICTLFSSDTQSFAGIGFAIPGNYAVEIAQMIINGEQVTHAYIGLSMMTVNAQNAAANNLSVDSGAYVAEVPEDGPAAAAGIQVGDIVVDIAGDKIDSADAAVLAIRSHSIGETVKVTVVRGDERLTFDVTLGSDEKLQELQAQQLEQQQREQEQQQDFWNIDTMDNGEGESISYEDLYNQWLEELFGEQNGQNQYGRP